MEQPWWQRWGDQRGRDRSLTCFHALELPTEMGIQAGREGVAHEPAEEGVRQAGWWSGPKSSGR